MSFKRMSPDQYKAWRSRNKQLYLDFQHYKHINSYMEKEKLMKDRLALKHSITYKQVSRLFTLYRRGLWEEYAPSEYYIKKHKAAAIAPEFIAEPTKQQLMTGIIPRPATARVMHWRGQTILLGD